MGEPLSAADARILALESDVVRGHALKLLVLEPGAEVVYAWPSFSIYPHLAAMSGARAVTVPLGEAGEHDLEAMAREVTGATRLVIVCNPNNPTATGLPPAAIDDFVAELPRHVAVFLDEAYVEFSTLQDPDESLGLLESHAVVQLGEEAGGDVHVADEVVHLLQRLGRRLDDHVDTVAEDVEVEVRDQGRHLDEGVPLQVQPGHLAVDPHQSVVHPFTL